MDAMALDEGGTVDGVLRERGANVQPREQLDRGGGLAKRARTGAGNAREEWIELVRWLRGVRGFGRRRC